MATRLSIVNGPNLNLLGEREPEIYGSARLADIRESCEACAERLGVDLRFLQSNHEGVLVEWIQEARGTADALIVNLAGCSFHSVPLLDAIRVFDGPVIELHISNIHARDEAHRHSKISEAVTAVICGFGVHGYVLAMQAAARLVGEAPDPPPRPAGQGPT